MIREIKSIMLKQIDNEIQREKISTATTLDDLGLNLEDAIQILEANNIPLILDENDKTITERTGDFKGLEDFVLVHVTRFPPSHGKIESPKEAEAMQSGYDVKLDGKTHYYEIPYMRDTVHFTVNNEVNTDHGYLNCDDCRYAVLIPCVDIPKERLKGEASDMYTVDGGPTLTSNSYILCPKGEAEKLKASNPGVNVIEYEGESVRGYAKAFISTLGYRQSETSFHGFRDDEDGKKFAEIIYDNGIEQMVHSYSEEHQTEETYGMFEKEMAVYKIIKENGLIQNEEDMTRIMEQLISQHLIETPETGTKIRRDIMGEEQKQYLLKRMKEEGIDLTKIIEEDQCWRDGDILQTAIDGLFSEKVQEAKNNLESLLQSWEEGCSTRRKNSRNRTNLSSI